MVQVEPDGAVEVVRWRGRGDFVAFGTAAAHLLSPSPDTFTAERRSVRLHGLDLEAWTLPAFAGEQPASSPDSTTLRIDVIRAGSVHYRLDGRIIEAVAGTAHLLPCSLPTAFKITRSCSVVRLTLRDGLVPAPLHKSLTAQFGPLPPSRLLAAIDILSDQLLESTAPDTEAATAEIVQKLARTLLSSLAPHADLPLRAQMLRYIDTHLTDPRLSPSSVARAFEISLRWAHRVFNVDDATIATYIRQQRCEAVARHLQEDHRTPRIGALAAAYGFAGRDQLTRTFKAHYGTTIPEYLAGMIADRHGPAEPAQQRNSVVPAARLQ